MEKSRILRGMPEYYEAAEEKERQPEKDIRYAMLNLPASCVLSCEKCARSEAREQLGREKTPPLTLTEQTRFLDLANEIGAQELVIIGEGEPTQANNWQKLYEPIIEEAHAKGMGTVMFTTAFFMTRKQAEFCHDHNVTIIVSLDSLDNANYYDMYGLDKWDKGGIQERSAKEFIRQPADHLKKKMVMLAEVYADSDKTLPNGRTITRLGLDTTIQNKNVGELGALREFAHQYGIYFVANHLMPEGRAGKYKNWNELVGSEENLARHKKLAAQMSDSGGHSSSIRGGACNYFGDGIACSATGELQTCGYASATAHQSENIRDIKSADELRWVVERNRRAYQLWCQAINRQPSCPLRDPDYAGFIAWINKERLGAVLSETENDKKLLELIEEWRKTRSGQSAEA